MHFLLVGDGADRATLRVTLGRLPVDAYGQVFVEVASPIQIEDWEAPEGVTVTWLLRRPGVARGGQAVRAAEAWVAEWMPESATSDAPYVIWIGCPDSPAVDRLYRELSARLPHLHLHHPHAGR